MKKVVLVTAVRNVNQIAEDLGDCAVLLNERDFICNHESGTLNINWLSDMKMEYINIAKYDSVAKYSDAKYVLIPFCPDDNNNRHILNSLMNYETGFIFAIDSNFAENTLLECRVDPRSQDYEILMHELKDTYDEMCIKAHQYKMPVMQISDMRKFAEFLKDDKVFEMLLEKIKGIEAYRFGSSFSDSSIKSVETLESNT